MTLREAAEGREIVTDDEERDAFLFSPRLLYRRSNHSH